jgi:hypothetical protein
MRRKIGLSMFFASLAMFSFAQGFSPRKGGHCYDMDIPDYMTRAYNLNDVASLQYQNLAIPAFLIVIEDEKSELEAVGMKFIGVVEFLDYFTKDFKKDAVGRRLGETTRFSSNGKDHAQTELYWKDDDTEYFMLVTAVESAGYYYKILCWAPLEAKGRVEADFRRASKSIRE